MLRYFYTILLYLIQPLIWGRLLYRSIKAHNYRKRWLERYGFCANKVKPNGILVHSVSVGESIAAIPLIKKLQQLYPNLPITVTTMTPTGSAQIQKTFENQISHVYLPYDLPGSLSRFLNHLQPKIVIIMETELWPNLIYELNKRQIPLVIANARLSERSANRYAKLGNAIKNLLPKISHVAIQNETDAKRFINLGLPKSQLTVTGSIKFDIQLSDSQKQTIKEMKSQWQGNFSEKRPIWIVASTHHGEDDLILMVHKQLLSRYPNLLLILVPRHPERFIVVEKLISDHGLSYQLRQDQLNLSITPNDDIQVVLGNTMGELTILFGLADIAFVGGSLVNRGGHNPLEPALHHLPIIMGEHTFNFKTICQQLSDANGLITTKSTKEDLIKHIELLLNDDKQRKIIGENAFAVLKQNQGALDRLLKIIDEQIIN